jgi:hypothetical protein
MVSPYWLKFAALPLFIEIIPIYKAAGTGGGGGRGLRGLSK